MSEDIKFSTAGFRAVTADGLTAQSVQRLTYGISEHILEHPFYGFEGTGYRKHCEEQGKKPKKPLVLVGYDTRFLSKQFAYVAANALVQSGITVKVAELPLPTPVAEWAVLNECAVGAVPVHVSPDGFCLCMQQPPLTAVGGVFPLLYIGTILLGGIPGLHQACFCGSVSQNAVGAVQILHEPEQLGIAFRRKGRNAQIAAVFAAFCPERKAVILGGADVVQIPGAVGCQYPLLAIQPVGGILLYVCPILHGGVGDFHHLSGVLIFKAVDQADIHLAARIRCLLQDPVLAGSAVDLPLLHIGAGSGIPDGMLGKYLLGMVIAYITAKRNYYGKRFIEVASVLMFAVPGTVLGISYILGFNSKPLALTGTGLILVIVFTFRNMPVAIESGTTTLLQIDNSIEEASTILGADTGYSFRRITLPMLKNVFFSGIVYSFTKAITAVSAVIFLVSPRWKLVTSNIYSLFDMAKYGQAAAFVTMMVGILLVFIGLFNAVINFLLAPRSKVPQAKSKTEESK